MIRLHDAKTGAPVLINPLAILAIYAKAVDRTRTATQVMVGRVSFLVSESIDQIGVLLTTSAAMGRGYSDVRFVQAESGRVEFGVSVPAAAPVEHP